jgi:hypothetical protein
LHQYRGQKTYDHHASERRRARLLRARGALCLAMLAACAVALIRSRSRDRGREAKGHHDVGRRLVPLLVGARDALCLVMLAAWTVAAMRSLTAVPPTVPACGLCALAAAFGSKGPPRGLRRA